MAAPSNPKSTDNSRIKPYFPNPNYLSNTDSRQMFVLDHSITNPDWKKKMKMKMKMISPQQKSSSLVLAPPTNIRGTLTLDKAIEDEIKYGRKLDLNMDTKKLRRTISNKLSAQRSRMRTSQYINNMEKMVKDLEEMISVLTPQVESYKENRKELLLQYDSLQKIVEIRSIESKISEMEIEQKRLEICRLQELAKLYGIKSRSS